MHSRDQNTQKQVSKKNQERCLNPKPFARSKAYLSRENCKKNILSHNYPSFEEYKEKYDPQDHHNWIPAQQDFDHDRIQNQIQKINHVIDSIELNKKQSKKQYENSGIQKSEGTLHKKHSSKSIREDKHGMVRIKSAKNVIKVYNPFPTPFAQMMQNE